MGFALIPLTLVRTCSDFSGTDDTSEDTGGVLLCNEIALVGVAEVGVVIASFVAITGRECR